MATLFPTTVTVALGSDLPDTYRTFKSKDDSSVILTASRWDCPKMRGGRLKFLVDSTDLSTIRDAWAAAYGSGTPVDFRYPWPDVWFGLYVGTGDGVTTIFDIPGYDTSDPTLYVNGVEDATAIFSAGGGANSRDRVTPTLRPADGDLLTVDFTGQRQILAVLGDVLVAVERGPGTFAVTLTLDEV